MELHATTSATIGNHSILAEINVIRVCREIDTVIQLLIV